MTFWRQNLGKKKYDISLALSPFWWNFTDFSAKKKWWGRGVHGLIREGAFIRINMECTVKHIKKI